MNGKLDRIRERIRELAPERITVFVDKGEEVLKVPICEAHRMIHAGEIELEDIKGDCNTVFADMGNCSADFEAWLHLLKCHMNGIHGKLSDERGWRDISEEEAHKKLLDDMASGQVVSW